jgi:hypothetical protein
MVSSAWSSSCKLPFFLACFFVACELGKCRVFQKELCNLKAYINLFRCHVQRFELLPGIVTV